VSATKQHEYNNKITHLKHRYLNNIIQIIGNTDYYRLLLLYITIIILLLLKMYWLKWRFTQVLQGHFTVNAETLQSCGTRGCIAIRLSRMMTETVTSLDASETLAGIVCLWCPLVGCSMHAIKAQVHKIHNHSKPNGVNYCKKNSKLQCGPMPNVMVALPSIGGALCSTLQSLAEAHY